MKGVLVNIPYVVVMMVFFNVYIMHLQTAAFSELNFLLPLNYNGDEYTIAISLLASVRTWTAIPTGWMAGEQADRQAVELQ